MTRVLTTPWLLAVFQLVKNFHFHEFLYSCISFKKKSRYHFQEQKLNHIFSLIDQQSFWHFSSPITSVCTLTQQNRPNCEVAGGCGRRLKSNTKLVSWNNKPWLSGCLFLRLSSVKLYRGSLQSLAHNQQLQEHPKFFLLSERSPLLLLLGPQCETDSGVSTNILYF